MLLKILFLCCMICLGLPSAHSSLRSPDKSKERCPPGAQAGMNPLAFNSRLPVDVFAADSAAVSAAHLAAFPVYRAAVEALSTVEVGTQAKAHRGAGMSANVFYTPPTASQHQGYLAALDPAASRCAFLSVQHIERAGLGHTLTCWGKYLSDAVDNELTYYSPFYSAAHGMCNLTANAAYFGLHPVFYWARAPRANATIVDVGDAVTKGGCSSESLRMAVKAFKSRVGDFSCEQRGDVVFRCHNEKEPFNSRFAKSAYGWAVPARAAFQAAHTLHGQAFYDEYVPSAVRAAKAQDKLVVVVHMRRGDVLQSKRIDPHRLMGFAAYNSVLRLLLNDLYPEASAIGGESLALQRPRLQRMLRNGIAIFFLCEGAGTEDQVLDVISVTEAAPAAAAAAARVKGEHRSSPSATSSVNSISNEALKSVAVNLSVPANFADPSTCTSYRRCQAHTLVDAGEKMLPSFSAMCVADILVTSPSSFPYAAAVLCTPPVVIAVPFSQSYSDERRDGQGQGLLPGVVPVLAVGTAPLWSAHAQVDLPGLDKALTSRLG